ncbi:hypothetical protein Taro_055573 [Colocasia esculenta]|uniref:Uncharacterized protein n=1 Tax=Colocasia esculenta TaxID=4460 RepID=A0A843XU22_COLES|nr:hypothetical protein [Colocasia esculenta]
MLTPLATGFSLFTGSNGCVDTLCSGVDTTDNFSSSLLPRYNACVDTHLTCVDTTVTRLWTNFYWKGSVDTPHTGVDTMLQALCQNMKKWSTSVDTSPSQVDTRDSSQRNMSTGFYIRSTPDAVDTRCLSQGTILPSLGQCVDTTYRQVDTLRKLYDLKFLLDTWHPRELMDWPWIVCPRTPRVPLDYLGYKYPPIGHPTQENLFRASQKSIWRQEEFSSLLLLSWCFLKPILICPSMRSVV